MNDGKVTIRINLDTLPLRLLILGLLAALMVGLVGSVAWAGERASPGEGRRYAPLSQGVSGRRYYLTSADTYDGNDAPGACGAGYHFASVWELLDVSNMTYNSALGYQHTIPDMGDGPPSDVEGWVRTGNVANVGPNVPGTHNCGGYVSVGTGYKGTVVELPSNWAAPGTLIGTWSASSWSCDSTTRVWCVED
ncbi:MAG: hypothetical protein GTO63_18630 [Anaerolineae bacterium]|nr:hypothetical protein [Anaerolineae bacterium]NIN96786.1 hypothetical protein [Anaerolineae bacterium]NIQ79782.1 hypothetical protein [Anaerolineae bacterium]